MRPNDEILSFYEGRILAWFDIHGWRGDYSLEAIGESVGLSDYQVYTRMVRLAELGLLDVSTARIKTRH